jgi:putative transposase
MTRNRRLARHVAGVGMAELRRQIEYKTTWSGGYVHIADRWYPSSKTCSGCGAVKAKLRLSERVYCCEACGLVLDRDLNAARNLAALVQRETSSPSCGATQNEPTGNPRKTRAARATGTATGRPAPTGAGQRRRGDASAA